MWVTTLGRRGGTLAQAMRLDAGGPARASGNPPGELLAGPDRVTLPMAVKLAKALPIDLDVRWCGEREEAL